MLSGIFLFLCESTSINITSYLESYQLLPYPENTFIVQLHNWKGASLHWSETEVVQLVERRAFLLKGVRRLSLIANLILSVLNSVTAS